MTLRGYFVQIDQEDWGVAVVATSAKDAKRIAYDDELSAHGDWIDVRVRWKKNCDVSDLPIGVIDDDQLALRRGLYGWCEQATCDVCGEDKHVESVRLPLRQDFVVACGDCIDDGMFEYHIEVHRMEARQ